MYWHLYEKNSAKFDEYGKKWSNFDVNDISKDEIIQCFGFKPASCRQCNVKNQNYSKICKYNNNKNDCIGYVTTPVTLCIHSLTDHWMPQFAQKLSQDEKKVLSREIWKLIQPKILQELQTEILKNEINDMKYYMLFTRQTFVSWLINKNKSN